MVEEYLKIKENVKWKRQRKNTVLYFPVFVLSKKSRRIIFFFNEFRRQQIIVNIRNHLLFWFPLLLSRVCLEAETQALREKIECFNQIIEVKHWVNHWNFGMWLPECYMYHFVTVHVLKIKNIISRVQRKEILNLRNKMLIWKNYRFHFW